MKRLSLLTAAALLASTPLFAMDGGGVSISGEANFGVKFKENDGGANAPNELQFHHEFKVTFAASGTTDGGIGFGGSMTLDNTESVAGTTVSTARPAIIGNTVPGIVLTAEHLAYAAGNGDAANQASLTSPVIRGQADIDSKTTDALVFDATLRGKLKTALANAKVGDIVIGTDGDDADTLVDDFAIVSKEDFERANGDDGEAAGTVEWQNASALAAIEDGKNKADNHGEVYISMDMHKLTIGSDLDRGDQVAGGLADVGFDGIGIDDIAEKVWAKTARDVRYDGDFGIAKVAFTYGDNKGDAEWAAGFNFNVEPVKVGAGFDSNGVVSVGMGFTQGQISMNALYSTDSDSDEADNEFIKAGDKGNYSKRLRYGEVNSGMVREGSNKPDLKNQAMGVDVTYQMTDATSLTLVAAQHKSESADLTATSNRNATTGVLDTNTDEYKDVKWVKSSTTVDAFGVGFSHDLGGGATLKAGAGSVDSNAVADLGITMKF